jgi:hypothetical protein
VTIQVVQWTTGVVGKAAARGLIRNPSSGTHVFDSGLKTAMPAINAIPAVCAARPGIVTAADLPVMTGAGLVSAGRAILAASALGFDGTSAGA